MEGHLDEAHYPITFRQENAMVLGDHIRLRESVELIGLKHVGINNFLRFFFLQPEIVTTYISPTLSHIFIPVDLQDLVEVDMFPFWILTFKRLFDTSEISITLSRETKKEISSLFTSAIQSRDTFLTIEYLKKAVQILVNNSLHPTIFFIRFDRLKDVFTEEVLSVFDSLREGSGNALSFVFTSVRPFEEIVLDVFQKKRLSVFSNKMYVKPAQLDELEVILNSFEKRYETHLSEKEKTELTQLCGGHIQYLQLSLLILNQYNKNQEGLLKEKILHDERIMILSEEIYDSLTDIEKEALQKVLIGKKIDEETKEKTKYLWDTGFITEKEGISQVFSPLFAFFLNTQNEKKEHEESAELTKKENALFKILHKKLNQVCERETIIEHVWPEMEVLGISDWTIDRLIARLRVKLKKQRSNYSIVTVKTRGYKMVEEEVNS